jgi:uncharacterized protein
MFRDKFTSDLKDAMRAGEKLKVSTIRLMTSAIKSADIEARPAGKDPIDDASIINVLAKMVKQRRDSAEQFANGGRPEMAANELAEIVIIESYLPKQMGEDEMKAVVTKIIAETGAATAKDMGKVMAALKAGYAGQMDFGKVGGIVKGLLK